MGNTVLAMPEDAGVLRLDETTGTGIALATDGNGRFAKLDPYAGAQLALAEAYRNVSATGGRPIAATDCLNFGSPEDPDVMWQFAEATRGLADACQMLGTVITGGNVSFYNQTGSTPINPTPVVGVLGLVDDVHRRTAMGFRDAGDRVLLLGETRDELGGSEWAWTMHGHLGGLPPAVDLAAEQALGQCWSRPAVDGLVTSVHDLSDGGLAQAVVESCLRHKVGASLALQGDPFVALFSESTARALVTVPAGDDRLTTLLAPSAGSRTPRSAWSPTPPSWSSRVSSVSPWPSSTRRTRAPCRRVRLSDGALPGRAVWAAYQAQRDLLRAWLARCPSRPGPRPSVLEAWTVLELAVTSPTCRPPRPR